MTKNKTVIGIIGGSGLDNLKLLKIIKQVTVKTPYGLPSDRITIGTLAGKKILILPRHGHHHTISPTNVNNRANIWALKKLNCRLILATTACGSLKTKIKPGHLVFLDQFIDFTKLRQLTFFDRNKVIHTPMAQPFDKTLRKKLIQTTKKLKFPYHPSGTMITIEGPRFSTKAESLMFQNWGADLINMSTSPEVILANEIGIPYQSIAMVTDYDCWKKSEPSVTFDLILKRMKQNTDKVKQVLAETIKTL